MKNEKTINVIKNKKMIKSTIFMEVYLCPVCGWVGFDPVPDKCPICNTAKKAFKQY
jgi:rubrerythrin